MSIVSAKNSLSVREFAMTNQIKRHKTTGAESRGTWVEPVATIREVEENEEKDGKTEP